MDQSLQSIPFPVTNESKQWLIMMKYMLECAEKSMEFLDKIKYDLEFNDEDLERFSVLCIALDQARHQMALLGKRFFEDISTDFLENLSITSDPKVVKVIKKPGFSQTGNGNEGLPTETEMDNFEDAVVKKEPTHKDACLCNVLDRRVVRKSKKNKIVVCSPMKRTSILNEKCLKEGKARKKSISFEDYPDDDNHPYIIKDPGLIELPENGFGYELFYAMHRHRKKIAQIDEATDDFQTFEEILRDAVSTAMNLKAKGLDEDSMITMCLANTKYSCIPYLAGLFLGCKMNAVDVSFGLSNIVYLLKISMPDLMFVQKEKVPVIEEALEKIGLQSLIIVVGGEAEGHEPFQEYLIASNEDIKKFRPYKADDMRRHCVILFSSGTSGLPKAICLSHYNLMGQVFFATITENLQRVFVSFTSYYWISSVILLGYCTLAGVARVVPLPFEATRFFRMIDKYKIESAFLGPFECVMALRTPKPPDVDTSSLKILCTGGAALRAVLFLGLRQVFPGCIVYQTYGQTECAGLIVKWATKDPEDLALLHAKPQSCGRSFGGFWYKIIDEETGKILGPHQLGMLCVKSDYFVMSGYYKLDSSTCLDDNGWLKTGDLAYFDDYNCLYVVDRIKELIKYRGWHVPPIILENALIGHPAVARAVVIGIPNDEDGEHPMGMIILKEGVDPETVNLEEMTEFVNQQVEDRQKMRGGVKIIHSIPLTATGKVRRRALREAYLRGDDL